MLRLVSCVLLVLFIVSPAGAQTGGVLPGVTVDLHTGGTERTATTANDGSYRFDTVPPGPAELTFKLINFTLVRRTVSVTADRSVTADAVLTIALSADIVVTGSR